MRISCKNQRLILDTEFISGHHMTFERNNWVCRPLLIQCPYGLRSTKNSQKRCSWKDLLGLRLQGRSHGRVETREKNHNVLFILGRIFTTTHSKFIKLMSIYKRYDYIKCIICCILYIHTAWTARDETLNGGNPIDSKAMN